MLPSVLPLLLERMRNEITRVTTVKTFALIAAAKLDVALTTPASGGTILELVVNELCSFLRKSHRPLRQASLAALDVIMSSHAAQLTDQSGACPETAAPDPCHNVHLPSYGTSTDFIFIVHFVRTSLSPDRTVDSQCDYQ